MGKDLIIVESPAKVKTIKKFLGNAYAVEASVGHVRDLPSKKLGVDEKDDFAPQYQIIPGKQKVVSKLKEAAASASTIYLAPDPDREGEAIAWHVAQIVQEAGVPVHRIQFNEITAKAVREALSHPRDINEKLFLSQQARRILDRLVGYKVSPILWQKVKSGISAGRVQSVALRLVVDREKERRAFVPVEYWNFKARLAADSPPEFEAELAKYQGKKLEIGSAEAAAAAEAAITGQPFVVTAVTEKERKKSPPPPFITSTLQQAANQRLGYSAKRTMGAAQKLYEGLELGDSGTVALITYMRTDSTRIADEARDAAREYITEALGPDYYPEKARHFRSKAGAQDAHEAIRPIDVRITPADVKTLLPKDLFSLYKLIWERFVASQMAEARFWDTAVDVTAGPGLFKAKGQRLIFPGYLKVYGQEAGDEAKSLPKLDKGQELTLLELKKEQKFTQPPPRYTEASLVRELEEKGIGRPSTYAAIISTLIDRDYARLEEKHFVPSELGETVSDLLAEHFVKIMDVGFTAGMEEALDAVADGRTDWVNLLKDFTEDFNPTLAKAAKDMAKVKAGKETDVKCELCGKPMVIRFGKAGEFLGCSGYPDCKNTKEFDRAPDGAVIPRERKAEEVASVGACPTCGKDLVVKKSRTGSRFIACTGWPDCKYTKPLSTGVPCPKEGCSGTLVEKSSKRGKVFYACDAYPQCDFAVWDWPINEPCPQCDSKILVRKKTRDGELITCPSKSCRYKRAVGGKKDEGEGEE
ncbi:type I DNA topoisomerase [Solidesulfovibrio magneticus]|uniref:DNA topoisomerase 1 n=1 Tax=Solidesulfovibrio magneticus (strain ATCC 700980 / DSM 13731 / RS-1) TaxID=573370 RepID=C4XSH3_SOLM1|nr:type I DNA topoisomerase [Solidesulfovibrio magneticus]BAH78105.1 DNA topoisomerase I [Solidesulfovibrio magneticus RS-1]